MKNTTEENMKADVNPVWTKILEVTEEENKILSTLLQTEIKTWNGNHSIGEVKLGTFLNKGKFLTGFLPKIEKDIKVEYKKDRNRIILPKDICSLVIGKDKNNEPYYLNPPQIEAVSQALEKERGIIVMAPRSGKTVIASVVIKLFLKRFKYKALFLAGRTILLTQAEEQFNFMGIETSRCFAGDKDTSGSCILATPQTFIKLADKELIKSIDMIFVDECHHIKKGSQYNKILKHSVARYRIGLTGTPPTENFDAMYLEGITGPVVYELTFDDSINMNITAKPKIVIKKVPEDNNLKRLKYKDFYEQGVVHRRSLNRLIVETAYENAISGNTSLILIDQIAHGNIVLSTFNRFRPELAVRFIHGSLPFEIQQKARQDLIDKNLDCVICTASLWSEGINIPTLGAVILGSTPKVDSRVMQSITRPLTQQEGGKTGIIVDFFDASSKYAVEHFGYRISIYCELGWL